MRQTVATKDICGQSQNKKKRQRKRDESLPMPLGYMDGVCAYIYINEIV